MTSRPLPTAADERAHAPGDGAWWCESWDYDFALTDARLGGYVRLDLLPNQGVCWYTAALVGAGRDPVVVVDHEVALPRLPGLELRSEGLWADHIVEDPLDHVSVSCEAFALRLDTGTDPLSVPLLGERVPFGLDLGWETDGDPVALPPGDGPDPGAGTGTGGGGYAVPCRVVGEVLVADERIELDATGWRHHTWGVPVPVPASVTGSWCWGTTNRSQNENGLVPVAEAPLLVPGDPPIRVARTLYRST